MPAVGGGPEGTGSVSVYEGSVRLVWSVVPRWDRLDARGAEGWVWLADTAFARLARQSAVPRGDRRG